MRRGGRRTVLLVAGVVATVMAGVVPAHGEPGMQALDALDAADKATRALANSAGIDVSSTATFARSADLIEQAPWPEVKARVPKHGSIVVHDIAAPDRSFYLSVRGQPSRTLLGSLGRQPARGPLWGTPSMMIAQPRATALRNGATDSTSVVGIKQRVLEPYNQEIVTDPVSAALALLLPPYSDAYDEGWTNVTMTTRADGSVLIAGQVPAQPSASDGEDLCSRPKVEVVVVNGIVQSGHWIEKCPGEATKEVFSTWSRHPIVVKPAPRPSVTAASVGV